MYMRRGNNLLSLLSPAEQKYGAYDRELLAIYLSIKHFKFMLEGRDFYAFTDHKPLIFAFPQKADKCSSRHLDLISQYTTVIRHVSGINNVVADVLSRVDTLSSGIDYKELAQS